MHKIVLITVTKHMLNLMVGPSCFEVNFKDISLMGSMVKFHTSWTCFLCLRPDSLGSNLPQPSKSPNPLRRGLQKLQGSSHVFLEILNHSKRRCEPARKKKKKKRFLREAHRFFWKIYSPNKIGFYLSRLKLELAIWISSRWTSAVIIG